MSERECLVAGSFDPVTLGHLDIIGQAAQIFDRVVVAILCNTDKTYMFTLDQRTKMLKASLKPVSRSVELMTWDGLLVDLLDVAGLNVVVRGLRDARDFDFERQIAAVNATLRPGTKTIWMSADPAHQAISSTIVRELVRFAGDVRPFVPPGVPQLITEYWTGQAAGAHGGE